MNRLLLLLVAAVTSESVELTVDNFDDLVTEHSETQEGWLIKFYAPWCPHCKKLAPEWTKFSNLVTGVNVGEVNCDDKELGQPICHRFRVQGYPTVLLFPAAGENGSEFKRFHGDRTADGFLDFVGEKVNKESSGWRSWISGLMTKKVEQLEGLNDILIRYQLKQVEHLLDLTQ